MPRQPHVLIVDDWSHFTHPLEVLLGRDGYDVTKVAPMPSLADVRLLHPDVIVHDLIFRPSQQASLAFLRARQHDPTLSTVPVLLSSLRHRTMLDGAMIEEVQALGTHVLLKPYGIATLLHAVSEALEATSGSPPPFGARPWERIASGL